MSAAVRSLALLLVGWAGVRAATLGVLPGADLFSLGRSEARTVRPSAAMFPPLDPAVPLHPQWPMSTPTVPASSPIAWQVRSIQIPYYIPARAPATYLPPVQGTPSHSFYPAVLRLEDWPQTRFAGAPIPETVPNFPTAVASEPGTAAQPKFDRLQLTAWALLRGRQGIGDSQSLASQGTLGGSQAGARLIYRFSPELAGSLRTTSAVGTSQSEISAGLRFTPVPSIPISITAERRQAIGKYGGRSGFALFAEGGFHGQSLWGLDLNGYAQAGMVGIRDRAFFADGAVAFSRPIYRQTSAGFGIWGGVQPGVYRVDAGPRVSYRVRPNVRVHVDWRHRIAGTASPGSGPAVTLAADF